MGDRLKELVRLIFVIFAVLLCLTAVCAELIAPHDPLAVSYDTALRAPDTEFPFGTDYLGRCMFSRVLHGLRSSFGMAFAIVTALLIVGTCVGVMSGYMGGVPDNILMRVSDMLLSFPELVLTIAVVGILGSGWYNTALAILIPRWVQYARVSRSLVLGLKHSDYILSAQLSGAKTAGIISRYIIPNIAPQMLTLATVNIGETIIRFATLSYLGLGTAPPNPELGVLLSEGRHYIGIAPWLMIYPGLAIFIAVVVFNMTSDTLADWLDPSCRQAEKWGRRRWKF